MVQSDLEEERCHSLTRRLIDRKINCILFSFLFYTENRGNLTPNLLICVEKQRAIPDNCLYQKRGTDLAKPTIWMLPVYTSPNQSARLCSRSSEDLDGWGLPYPSLRTSPMLYSTMGCFTLGGAGRMKQCPAPHTRAQHAWDEVMRMRKPKSATEKTKKNNQNNQTQ